MEQPKRITTDVEQLGFITQVKMLPDCFAKKQSQWCIRYNRIIVYFINNFSIGE